MAQVLSAPQRKSKPAADDVKTACEAETKSFWRKTRKWVARSAFALLVLTAVVGTWAKVQFDRIERDATQLSETGISLNAFLKQFATALKAKDIDALLAFHATNTVDDSNWELALQSDRDGVQVYDWVPKHQSDRRTDSLREQLDCMVADCEKIDTAKVKISSIKEIGPNGDTTITAVLWLRGSRKDDKHFETRAGFEIDLAKVAKDDWRITTKRLHFGQTVIGGGSGFENITEKSGIDYTASHNPNYELNEWRPRAFGIMRYSSGGVSAADYDGDGMEDVLFTDGGSTRLYKCVGDGKFVDTTYESGLPTDIKGGTIGLFADFDNDGDKDLLLCRGTGSNFLFRNDGGRFVDATEGSGVQGLWVATGSVVDYDNDGLLDVYLGRYLDPRKNIPTTSFYTRNSEGNTLLHNEGDMRFSDATSQAGVREGGLTLGTAWGDYDNDGFQDLYVANDFGRNTLFRNLGDGTFADVSEETGTLNIGYGMSAQWGDIDNDLDLDLIVGALHSGQRWYGNSLTIQRYLLSSVKEGTIREDWPTYFELYHYLGSSWQDLGHETLKGNTLLLNNGDGTFSDATDQSRVNPHGWYWSTLMFDYDNDCHQDIYAVNGWITGKLKDDL